MPLSDQLKQLVELHKAAEQAMRGLIVWIWTGEPLSGSYFGLVRRLVEACPRLEVIKQSVCIEGARRAFARAKVHWAKLDAVKLVKEVAATTRWSSLTARRRRRRGRAAGVGRRRKDGFGETTKCLLI